MESFRALIDAYGLHAFAADIGVREGTAKQMRKRNSVDSVYWNDWVAGAERRGRKNVTLDLLARLAAKRRPERYAPPTPLLDKVAS
jgi:hypothetical protein